MGIGGRALPRDRTGDGASLAERTTVTGMPSPRPKRSIVANIVSGRSLPSAFSFATSGGAVEHGGDLLAFDRRHRVEQVGEIGDPLRRMHADGAIEQLVALAGVDVQRDQLRNAESGDENEHQPSEETLRDEAHYRLTFTATAST
jgi:hypothetical protein